MTGGHKATIETIVNTSAIALTGFGVTQIIGGSPNFPMGYLALICGFSLEYFKYWGRREKLW